MNRTGAALSTFFSTPARTIFSRRPTPEPFSSHAGSDFNAMETNKALGDDPSGVRQARAIFSLGKDFKNRISIYFARQ
jgi:hypothetical protein